MNKDIRKTIRFSKDEFEIVSKKLEESKVSFSDFSRSAILRKQLKTNISNELIYEVNKIGNNLNQIAKKLNRDEKIDTYEKLKDIENQMEKLIEKCM